MAERHKVGVPTPRIDGEYKVSGKAKYAVDITFPDMLWGKILRSPIAYGRIKRIDTSKAMKVPGVVGVITGQDVAGQLIGNVMRQLQQIRDSLAKGDRESVRREAHAIKGGAATLEATALSKAAAHLEKQSPHGLMEELEAGLGNLENQFHRFRDFVSQWKG